MIEALFNVHSMFATKHWETSQPQAPDKRIWRVQYDRQLEKVSTENQQYDIDSLRMQLGGTLKDIAMLARAEDMSYWADKFDKAYAILYHLTPEAQYYHHDLLASDQYALAARQLLFAAGEAWVFGGMGWWNDNTFNDKESYERLTGQLYDTINKSVVAAVNSF